MARKSDLWQEITDKYFQDMDPRALDHFREPDSVNKRLASWSPTDNSSRHFKFLLWNALEGMDDDFFTYTRCIRNRSLGNPTTVRYRTMDIDLDYMLAVDELLFLEKQNRILSRCRTVVEVGAGFGSTAHAILENFSQIDKYTIIDLPEMGRASCRGRGENSVGGGALKQ